MILLITAQNKFAFASFDNSNCKITFGIVYIFLQTQLEFYRNGLNKTNKQSRNVNPTVKITNGKLQRKKLKQPNEEVKETMISLNLFSP